ncbi:hypothetical protein DXU07_40035 [Bradyrhizobium elkanii]
MELQTREAQPWTVRAAPERVPRQVLRPAPSQPILISAWPAAPRSKAPMSRQAARAARPAASPAPAVAARQSVPVVAADRPAPSGRTCRARSPAPCRSRACRSRPSIAPRSRARPTGARPRCRSSPSASD